MATLDQSGVARARGTGTARRAAPHPLLASIAREVVREALAARGIAYVPYVYASGLFERGWPQLRAPLETHWRPYVDGQIALVEAVRQVMAAVPSGR